MYKFNKEEFTLLEDNLPQIFKTNKQHFFIRIGEDLFINLKKVYHWKNLLSFKHSRSLISLILRLDIHLYKTNIDSDIIFMTGSIIRIVKDNRIISCELGDFANRDIKRFFKALECKKNYKDVLIYLIYLKKI